MAGDNQLVNGFVYFFQPAGGGRIKIGWSKRPNERLSELAVWSPMPLVLLAALPGHHMHEQMVHARFSHLRAHLEWFEPGPDLIKFIEERLAAGKLPEEMLADCEFATALPRRYWLASAIPNLLAQTGSTIAELAASIGVSRSTARQYKYSGMPDYLVPAAVRFFRSKGISLTSTDLYLTHDRPFREPRKPATQPATA
jgi:hypothetical protein